MTARFLMAAAISCLVPVAAVAQTKAGPPANSATVVTTRTISPGPLVTTGSGRNYSRYGITITSGSGRTVSIGGPARGDAGLRAVSATPASGGP